MKKKFKNLKKTIIGKVMLGVMAMSFLIFVQPMMSVNAETNVSIVADERDEVNIEKHTCQDKYSEKTPDCKHYVKPCEECKEENANENMMCAIMYEAIGLVLMICAVIFQNKGDIFGDIFVFFGLIFAILGFGLSLSTYFH